MSTTRRILCATLGLILPVAASANELAPLQSGTFQLRDHTASVYYTVQSESFEVVATIAPTNGEGAPSRFTARLMPGQTATVEVGAFNTRMSPAVLEFRRIGDLLDVAISSGDLLAAH